MVNATISQQAGCCCLERGTDVRSISAGQKSNTCYLRPQTAVDFVPETPEKGPHNNIEEALESYYLAND